MLYVGFRSLSFGSCASPFLLPSYSSLCDQENKWTASIDIVGALLQGVQGDNTGAWVIASILFVGRNPATITDAPC